MTNVIKGVLVRSRLLTVGVLKLMYKNILSSTCKLYFHLMLLHTRKIRGFMDINMFPMGCRFYLKTGSSDLFPRCKSSFSIASLGPESYKVPVLRTNECRHSLLILFSSSIFLHTISFLCVYF